MNRFARWGFALAILPVAACANNPPPPPAPMAPPAPPPLAAADASFVTMAAQGGMAEIAEANIALKMSHNPHIKMFAHKMITDHTQADDQLKQIAMAKGVTLPTGPSDMQMQEGNSLQNDHGRKFDHDYISDQIADHQQMLTAFQAEAANGTDADLKKFASDTVPVIQSHLDDATRLAGPKRGMAHHMMKPYHHHTSTKAPNLPDAGPNAPVH